ncbi:LOW QUALITY PROTEIN: Histone H1.1 [Plecturocebus cupreus]
MSETAPSASADPEKPSAGEKAKKPAKQPPRKNLRAPLSELIVQAAASSKERGALSLAALKKALAATGSDVGKNNSRIELGEPAEQGHTGADEGTGASASFKLNKKASSVEAKHGASKVAAKTKATGASRKVTGAATKKNVKTPKRAKKPAATRKPSRSPKTVKPKKVTKSPAKTKAVRPKAAKGKLTKPQTAKPKKAAPKKK